MSNEKHLEFSKLFGELDSNPLVFGQKTRLGNENLFDISNLAADNKTILEPTDRRFKFGKVQLLFKGFDVFREMRFGMLMLRLTSIEINIRSLRLILFRKMVAILMYSLGERCVNGSSRI